MSGAFAKVAEALGFGAAEAETVATVIVIQQLTDKEVAELARSCIGAAESLHQHLQRLRASPVTVYDFLLGVIPDHGVDFSFLDSLLARADDALAADPAAAYTHLAARHSLASARDELVCALDVAEPLRAVPRP